MNDIDEIERKLEECSQQVVSLLGKKKYDVFLNKYILCLYEQLIKYQTLQQEETVKEE